MAQVNIASLGELWAGTLSWTLDTSQTVYAADSKGSLSPGSSSYPWTGSSPYTSTQSVTVPSTGSNRYIFLFYYARHAQRNSTLNSNFTVTLNGVTLSQLGGAASYWSWDGGTGAVYYGPAPTTGAQNVVTSHTNASGNSTSYNFECDYFFMYNVHQTVPLKLQSLTNTDDGATLHSSGHFQSWYNYYYGTWQSFQKSATGNPGDVGLLFRGHEYYSRTMTLSSSTSGTTFTRIYQNGSNGEVWMSACPSGSTGTWDWNGSITYDNSSNLDYNSSRLCVLNPAPPTTPLFTVPTGYVVKVNQVYLGTSEGGLTASLYLNDLPAAGEDPQSIENSSGTDVITATGNDALGNLVSGQSVGGGTATKMLTQPLWLTEGAKLIVSTSTPKATMVNSTTFSATAKADCLVSMEVMKQST